jgi:hypothetical protein
MFMTIVIISRSVTLNDDMYVPTEVTLPDCKVNYPYERDHHTTKVLYSMDLVLGMHPYVTGNTMYIPFIAYARSSSYQTLD